MSQIVCSHCGASWPEAYQFCGRCGSALRTAVPPPPSGPAPIVAAVGTVRLVVLRGAVAEGTRHDLAQGRTVIGKSGDLAFPSDPILSTHHAVFERRGTTLRLVEASGRSGCFHRIREPDRVPSGTVLFAGEQYLLVRLGDRAPGETVSSDAPAEVFGTPLPPPHLHVTQLLAGGLPGRVASTDGEVLTVGRENCDLSFPLDRYMSGRHLRLEVVDGEIQVTDVGSLNGTFLRAKHLPLEFENRDELMIGTLLFRVDLLPD